jgi:hypothetical protein
MFRRLCVFAILSSLLLVVAPAPASADDWDDIGAPAWPGSYETKADKDDKNDDDGFFGGLGDGGSGLSWAWTGGAVVGMFFLWLIPFLIPGDSTVEKWIIRALGLAQFLLYLFLPGSHVPTMLAVVPTLWGWWGSIWGLISGFFTRVPSTS